MWWKLGYKTIYINYESKKEQPEEQSTQNDSFKQNETKNSVHKWLGLKIKLKLKYVCFNHSTKETYTMQSFVL
jgi:hypothetical protein